MSTFAREAFAHWRPVLASRWGLRGLASGLLLLLLGAELAVLVAWLPDTLAAWWRGDRAGDFRVFYDRARDLEANGLYSPFFSLVLHPLTHLDPLPAYRIYAGLGGLAALAVAYLAQRPVNSLEGKLAVALGVLSLPQLHWALRIGHLTPFLTLAALGGFLLLGRRPVAAGACLALLSLKPQYLAVPVLYLFWTKRWRPLAALAAAAGLMELAGLAAVGFDALAPLLRGMLDWGGDARDNLLPAQQAWQYAWPGFLLSAGLEPHPLVVFDLVALSLAVVVLVWLRAAPAAALPAAALGMLLVTPYANFYDWTLLAVPAALLLRARLCWQALAPAAVVVLYAAALASQAATPYPIELEVAEAGVPQGLYWVTPAAFGVLALLAALERRPESAGSEEEGAAP